MSIGVSYSTSHDTLELSNLKLIKLVSILSFLHPLGRSNYSFLLTHSQGSAEGSKITSGSVLELLWNDAI